jgi:hypothetical protein
MTDIYKVRDMKKSTYEIDVATDKHRAWEILIGKNTYPIWTQPFNPASHFIGDWSEGSKMLFVGEDQQGNKGGMVSRIVANRPGELVSIEHYGVLEGDTEITDSEEIAKWAGAHENYFFATVGDKTRITVEMDIVEDYEQQFAEIWPKALQKLKELCEE